MSQDPEEKSVVSRRLRWIGKEVACAEALLPETGWWAGPYELKAAVHFAPPGGRIFLLDPIQSGVRAQVFSRDEEKGGVVCGGVDMTDTALVLTPADSVHVYNGVNHYDSFVPDAGGYG